MSKTTYLVMKYHPAKKEVEFETYFNGKKSPINDKSVLMNYKKGEKGKFILQDHGNSFFNDIVLKVFSGCDEVHIKAITTQLDFEDFEQMVEYYNSTEGKENGRKITTELFEILPDMNDTFEAVKAHGEEAVKILSEYGEKLKQRELENKETRILRDNLVKIIDEETKNIKEITEKLEDTSVNLCFTGAYSSGKSTLINALLGAQILPEYIESKTAKMFIISSPLNNEPVKIEFYIDDDIKLCIVWDNENGRFAFTDSSESNIQRELQEIVNYNKHKKQHEQLLLLLQKINDSSSITSDISLHYPIPMDNSKVKFTIYDTPGTDSNHEEHKSVLTSALSEQAQSILIFVGKPDGLEGSANNALLDYLKEAEEKAQTNIDISRSIFVINKADTVSGSSRKSLQKSEIKYKDDDTFSIPLENKKLLFVSAIDGRKAAELKNGTISMSDKKLSHLVYEICDDEYDDDEIGTHLCYCQNKVGDSQLLTDRLINDSNSALKKAESEGDKAQMLWIGTGMYALESEILKFGEKYASAVRAYAIISSVEKSLDRLARQVSEIREQNQKNAEEIQKDINALEKTIKEAIDSKYKELEIGENDPFPDKVLKKLGIDSKSIDAIIFRPLRGFIEEQTIWAVKKETKETTKSKLNTEVNRVMKAFYDNFYNNRSSLLENNRDLFMDHIKDTIKANGDISDEAKKAFMDLPAPNIGESDEDVPVDKTYNNRTKNYKFFKVALEIYDNEGLFEDLKRVIIKKLSGRTDDLKKDYRDSLQTVLNDVSELFKNKLSEYSITMHALIKDHKEALNLGETIEKAYDELLSSQNILNKKILRSDN